ncbi:MAG: hypothetical protein WC091_03925 [Sulfuricellaceae bacterium]
MSENGLIPSVMKRIAGIFVGIVVAALSIQLEEHFDLDIRALNFAYNIVHETKYPTDVIILNISDVWCRLHPQESCLEIGEIIGQLKKIGLNNVAVNVVNAAANNKRGSENFINNKNVVFASSVSEENSLVHCEGINFSSIDITSDEQETIYINLGEEDKLSSCSQLPMGLCLAMMHTKSVGQRLSHGIFFPIFYDQRSFPQLSLKQVRNLSGSNMNVIVIINVESHLDSVWTSVGSMSSSLIHANIAQAFIDGNYFKRNGLAKWFIAGTLLILFLYEGIRSSLLMRLTVAIYFINAAITIGYFFLMAPILAPIFLSTLRLLPHDWRYARSK